MGHEAVSKPLVGGFPSRKPRIARSASDASVQTPYWACFNNKDTTHGRLLRTYLAPSAQVHAKVARALDELVRAEDRLYNTPQTPSSPSSPLLSRNGTGSPLTPGSRYSLVSPPTTGSRYSLAGPPTLGSPSSPGSPSTPGSPPPMLGRPQVGQTSQQQVSTWSRPFSADRDRQRRRTVTPEPQRSIGSSQRTASLPAWNLGVLGSAAVSSPPRPTCSSIQRLRLGVAQPSAGLATTLNSLQKSTASKPAPRQSPGLPGPEPSSLAALRHSSLVLAGAGVAVTGPNTADSECWAAVGSLAGTRADDVVSAESTSISKMGAPNLATTISERIATGSRKDPPRLVQKSNSGVVRRESMFKRQRPGEPGPGR